MSARHDFYEARRMARIRAQLSAGRTVTLRRMGRGRFERLDDGEVRHIMSVRIPAGVFSASESVRVIVPVANTSIADAAAAPIYVTVGATQGAQA